MRERGTWARTRADDPNRTGCGLANRGIVGHSVGRARDAGLVLAAFCTLDFPLVGVQVFRTGRGGEFDDTRIDELLDVLDIKGSLPRKGNPYDNAVVESTDRLLKKELVYRNRYTTIGPPRRGPGGCVWFQVAVNAYERQSVIYTTNIESGDWGRVFDDPNMATAIVDRTVHHGRIIRFEGESYKRTHALMG